MMYKAMYSDMIKKTCLFIMKKENGARAVNQKQFMQYLPKF